MKKRLPANEERSMTTTSSSLTNQGKLLAAEGTASSTASQIA
ncbi:MAG TPA: hypothetical protein VMU84_14215 [Thermoanaerobaculia bacterium]|nr:hypothetical protein [Thermoanaerobaculia bacterium]